MKALTLWTASLGVLAFLAGCSGKDGNGNPDDGGPADLVVSEMALPDGFVLYGCDAPGETCNPHNDCAIDPICGTDHKCRPTQIQSCDDGLECTKDICKGMGLCDHVSQDGWCALPVRTGGSDGGVGQTEIKCFKDKDRSPVDACMVCNADPQSTAADPTKWTPANGGACDDGIACTKDDYCQSGVCKGNDFSQECSDSVDCTEDTCDGNGGCTGHKLRADACLINGQCVQDQQTDSSGCNICDVKQSQEKWTPLVTHCLISNKCYKPGDKDSTLCGVCDPTTNDKDWTPLPGLCKISSSCYQAGAKNSGGCAECDPAVSNTAWTVKGDNCLINSTCFKGGANDSTGCGVCDPTKSTGAWSPVANQCLISGKCYATGAQDATKCAECDPAVSTTAWTVKGSNCLISSTCYTPGQPDATGCAACDPTKSKTAFTPVQGKCLIGNTCYADQAKDSTGCLMCAYGTNPSSWSAAGATKVTVFNFEDGKLPQGWVVTNSDPKVGWVVSNKRPAGGSYSLYYGDPAAGDYDSGTANNGKAALAPQALTAGKKAGLSFALWMDVEAGAGFDTLEVYVGTDLVWQKDMSTVPKLKIWKQVEIDLSKYAGQSVAIRFVFDTTDSVSNTGEGVYIDNVTIYDNC
jgi:hypothetical protein